MAVEIDVQGFDGKTEFGGSYLITEGEQLAFVSDVVFKTSSSGNPMLEVSFEVMGKDNADSGKQLRFQFYVLTEKAIGRFIGLCRAIDKGMRKFDASDSDALNELIYGMPLVIEVQTYEDEYNGEKKMRQRVNRHRCLSPDEESQLVEWYGEGMVPAIDDSDVPY